MKNTLVIFLLGAIVWSCAQLKSEVAESDSPKDIALVAHRGANRLAPENTLAAMKKAVELGADYIEIDLSVSADGVPYCFHDKTLNRTTDGEGTFSQANSAEIDTLDAGSWFSPAFKNERPPRVADIFKALKDKTRFYLDVKSAGVDELITLIKEEKLEKGCFVWFADEEKTGELRKKAPEIPVKMNAKTVEDVQRLVEAYRPEIIEADIAHITPEMQQVCKTYGVKLMANLLRDSWWEYEKAIAMQVDMVNIDHPDYFISMLNTPQHTFKDFRLAAHRGGIIEGLFAEFDPRSLQAAIDSGYWMLEIDVRPTADSQIIVHHDHDLKRIYGVDKKVSDMTLAELKKLRAIDGNYAPMTFDEVARMCRGKIRFMIDIKPKVPEPWFCAEINRVLEKYNMLEQAYFIRNDIRPYFRGGKFGFRMSELEEIKKRLGEGEDIAAHYYLFDHGNKINAETSRWCQRNYIKVCASVNIGHYRMEDHVMGARRDIVHLINCGVTFYQIDSDYDGYFKFYSSKRLQTENFDYVN